MDNAAGIANRLELIEFLDNINETKAVDSAVEAVIDDIMKTAAKNPEFCIRLNAIIRENQPVEIIGLNDNL